MEEYDINLLSDSEHLLMNGDIPTLLFNLEDMYIKVINNKYLPYELKDYVQDTSASNIRKAMKDIETLRDYLSSRTLNLSRENAKVILNVAALPQSLNTTERLKITFACKGLTMIDNFWLKSKRDAKLCFADVNLRENHLSEVSYVISILGKHISATADELRPDLSTHGMFPKYWRRLSDGVYMWKTDTTKGNVNTKAELLVSKYLRDVNANALRYFDIIDDGKLFAVSRCMANDKYSLISALSVRDWCIHTGKDFMEYIHEYWLVDFANMCIVDYIFANTDRPIDNWSFLVENIQNKISKFAPLHDHNQAVIADELGTDIDELIYEPTGKTFRESIIEYAKYSDLDFSVVDLYPKAFLRWKFVEQMRCQDRVLAIDILDTINEV